MRHTHLFGFTLIEVLAVVAIIGVMAALTIGPVRSAQQRNRDATRKSDVNLIAQALDLYYSENRTLPSDGINCEFTSRQAPPWIPGLNQRYLPSSNGRVLPVDPLKNKTAYFYTYTNYLCIKQNNPSAVTHGQSFKVKAILENKKDSDATPSDGGKTVYEVSR